MNKFDKSFLSENIKYLAGTDEAGRGPLAGPVVAAAVIFDQDVIIRGVKDSKMLTEAERENLYPKIISRCLSYSVCAISNWEIDRINILRASLSAMNKCINRLEIQPDLVLIDGNMKFETLIPCQTIVHGDAKSFTIAAASIIAKVTRDRIMKRLCLRYPNYLWEKNKGYATKQHIEALKLYGPCCLHRKSFIKKIMSDENPVLDFKKGESSK